VEVVDKKRRGTQSGAVVSGKPNRPGRNNNMVRLANKEKKNTAALEKRWKPTEQNERSQRQVSEGKQLPSQVANDQADGATTPRSLVDMAENADLVRQ